MSVRSTHGDCTNSVLIVESEVEANPDAVVRDSSVRGETANVLVGGEYKTGVVVSLIVESATFFFNISGSVSSILFAGYQPLSRIAF